MLIRCINVGHDDWPWWVHWWWTGLLHPTITTLWLCQNSCWKWPIDSWFTQLGFSIAMLVYQRVYANNPAIYRYLPLYLPKKTCLVARVFGATLMDGNSVFLNGMLQRSRSIEGKRMTSSWEVFPWKVVWLLKENHHGHRKLINGDTHTQIALFY